MEACLYYMISEFTDFLHEITSKEVEEKRDKD